jgi:hypothetical protein
LTIEISLVVDFARTPARPTQSSLEVYDAHGSGVGRALLELMPLGCPRQFGPGTRRREGLLAERRPWSGNEDR